MLVILFRSRLNEQVDGYEAMANEMLELGRGMPGFIDFKSFRAEDGEQLSVAWWENQETLAAWRNHPRHKLAQRRCRERWYAYFKVEVAHVVRATDFFSEARRGAKDRARPDPPVPS
jgi:heme-degrading monooxygenase HmoA